MNLRQSKALVTKIQELLHRDQHKPQAARLAKEFLEICEATNKRLEQCVSMVENHNIVGAVQLANQSPPVMEMIKILSIDEASKWAQYCDNQNLPQAPVFDASSIRALTHALQNEDEIGPTHPLSREFTQLMMSRDFTGAYGVLQAILELDPSNQSANQARPEVEQGVLRTQAKKLNAALRDNDMDAVNRLVEEVEDMPFFEAKQLDCWPQAKACQVDQWLGQTSAAIQAQDWQTSSELLDKVLQTQKQVAGLSLNQKQENFVREASEWTEQKESTWLKEEEYNDAVRQLDAFLQNRENDRARNVSHRLKDLREAKRQLDECWARLQAIEQAVPRELQGRTQRERAGLARDIQQMEKGNVGVTVVVVAACLAICAFVVVCIVSQNSGKELRANLESAIAERRVGSLKGSLTGIKMLDLKKFLVAGLKETMSEAQLLIKQEEEQLAAVDAHLSGLEKEKGANFGNQRGNDKNIELFTDKLITATNMVAKLAPEFVSGQEDRLVVVQSQWLTVLREEATKKATEDTDLLVQMEAILNKDLQPGKGPVPVRKGLKDIQPLLTQWHTTTNRQVPMLQPGTAIRQRFANVEAAHVQYGGFLRDWDNAFQAAEVAGTAANPTKVTLQDYLAAIAKLQTNALTEPNIVDDLKLIAQAKIDLDVIIKEQITPATFKGDADFLMKLSGPLSLKPDAPDGPAIIFLDDKFITQKYVNCEVVWIVAVTFAESEMKLFSLKSVQGPWDILYIESGQPGFEFNKKCRLHKFYRGNRNQIAFSEEVYRPIPDNNQAYRLVIIKDVSSYLSQKNIIRGRLGISDLWDRDKKEWTSETLAILDRLNQFVRNDAEVGVTIPNIQLPDGQLGTHTLKNVSNPWFIAYLAGNLYEFMDLMPGEWGLEWSPQVQRDRESLRKLRADNIKAGDWMISDLRERKEWLALRTHFFNAAKISYVKEAREYHRLLSSAYDGGRGIRFSGYQRPDMDDTLQWLEQENPGSEIFGFTTNGYELLYTRNPDGKFIIVSGNVQPLTYTPLFSLSKDRKQLLDNFIKTMNNGDYDGHLPPLFDLPKN